MPTPQIRPLRDVSDHEIIPFFKFNPTGVYPTLKGAFVKIISGASSADTVVQLGPVGAPWQNVVSNRYGVQPYVAQVTNSGDLTIGLTLYDVREYDENGEKLILHPDKAARMQAVVSGQPVPILRRGLVLYSGVDGIPVGGDIAYLSPAGNGSVSTSGTAGVSTKVGTFYGPPDSNGYVFLFVDVSSVK